MLRLLSLTADGETAKEVVGIVFHDTASARFDLRSFRNSGVAHGKRDVYALVELANSAAVLQTLLRTRYKHHLRVSRRKANTLPRHSSLK